MVQQLGLGTFTVKGLSLISGQWTKIPWDAWHGPPIFFLIKKKIFILECQ